MVASSVVIYGPRIFSKFVSTPMSRMSPVAGVPVERISKKIFMISTESSLLRVFWACWLRLRWAKATTASFNAVSEAVMIA